MDKKERFILKNKASFKKRYGADWERVLYSTANKMFKEEHGAGDWGTDKLTSKYLKDTPGQEDAIVKSKKVVLKKKAVEEEKPAEPKNKVMPDNKGYAERQAAAKKAKEDRMQRMVRARLAGGPPRKNRGAFWRREKTHGESVEVVESDKAEYNKLMDKYGDMPMSKVPMKARLRIRELGRSVRGDKGGPTAGDLVKSMKRRRMGEEVEQVDENRAQSMTNRSFDKVSREKSSRSDGEFEVKYAKSKRGPIQVSKFGTLNAAKGFLAAVEQKGMKGIISKNGKPVREEVEQVEESVVRPSWRRTVTTGGWIAMYNGKKVEIKKGEAKDLHAAKLKAIQMLKVPKSKQGLLAIKPAVHEEVEQVVEQKFEVGDIVVAKKGPHKGDKHEVVHIDNNGNVNVWPVGKKNKYREGANVVKPADLTLAEGGMIGRTKPSRELNVQKDEKPHLAGVKSLKYQKRAAHKAERKKGKQDVKINPELDETVERAKRGVDMAKQRVLAAKRKLHRTKARDIGQKMREDTEIEEGGINIAQAGRSADYKSRVGGTQQRYAANRAKRSARATEKHSDVMRRRAIARARSRMRKR